MINGNVEKFDTPLRQINAAVELLPNGSTGKNLARLRPTVKEDIGGIVSIKDENGIFTINGTTTIDYNNAYLTPYLIASHGERNKFPAGTYSISITEYGGSMTGYYSMAIQNSKGVTYPGLQRKLVLTEESQVSIFVQFRLGQGADNLRISVQMEEGETVTEYEPYVEKVVINNNTDLQSATVDRVGESKFFGYGVSQKLKLIVRDIERKYNVTTDNNIKLLFDNVRTLPIFNVTEVSRNENSNLLSITAFDVLNAAGTRTVEELGLVSYTIGEFATACGTLLGVDTVLPALDAFGVYYEEGANFSGTESIREALNDVAEATQTIYFINADNKLEFMRLDKDGEPVYTIDKSKYFTLDSKTNRELVGVCSATELGDNVEATLGREGVTQYIRDNAFYAMREDIAELVDNALAATGGLTINQFTCNWRGNYLLEIGDKLAFTTKDNGEVISYLLNDTISYTGGYSQKSQWEYAEGEKATSTNPTSLGEALKQTFAKVDKQNKEISLVSSELTETKEQLSTLKLDTESISATVSTIEENAKELVDGLSDDVQELTKRVNATMTSEEVQIVVQNELANGTSKVQTETGFTFNENGLTVAKNNNEIKTTITENGMIVYKDTKEMLTANNEGVKAEDLHATTFLIIGNTSRFESIDNDTRTACFWIGG